MAIISIFRLEVGGYFLPELLALLTEAQLKYVYINNSPFLSYMGKPSTLQKTYGRREGRGQGIEDWKNSSGRTILTPSRGRKNRREKWQKNGQMN
jgi:hypothetical protein